MNGSIMTDAHGRLVEGPGAALHTSGDATDATSDEELVRRAQDIPDDPAAFAELYRRHLPRIYRYLMARLSDPYLAQDATAQTFLAALEGIGSFRGSGEFRAWLLMIAHNKAMDIFRARRATVPLEAVVDVASPAPSPQRPWPMPHIPMPPAPRQTSPSCRSSIRTLTPTTRPTRT